MVQSWEHVVKCMVSEIGEDQEVGSRNLVTVHDGIQLTQAPVVVSVGTWSVSIVEYVGMVVGRV